MMFWIIVSGSRACMHACVCFFAVFWLLFFLSQYPHLMMVSQSVSQSKEKVWKSKQKKNYFDYIHCVCVCVFKWPIRDQYITHGGMMMISDERIYLFIFKLKIVCCCLLLLSLMIQIVDNFSGSRSFSIGNNYCLVVWILWVLFFPPQIWKYLIFGKPKSGFQTKKKMEFQNFEK